MTLLEDAEGDRVAIAALEDHGLSLRAVNALEEHGGFIYVDELEGVTAEQLLSLCSGSASFGPLGLSELRTALRNFLEDPSINTVIP